MKKATSGPWKVVSMQGIHYDVRSATSDLPICLVSSTGKQPTEANAQLIAAAPDMLDMLERLNRGFDVAVEHDDPIMKRLDYHHKRIKETIAKATGAT